MLQIDETTVGKHFWLENSDRCFYVWEYTAGKRYDRGPTNQLISNLKIKPTQIGTNPSREYYKLRAIEHCAAALRMLIKRSWVEKLGTFVPVPCSKIPGHADHDNRVERILRCAFGDLDADIRPLLEQISDTAADHESDERLPHATLLTLTRVNDLSAMPPRRFIAVVDDVLNSGKHFKVAQQLLSQCFPSVPVLGVFIVRCVRD